MTRLPKRTHWEVGESVWKYAGPKGGYEGPGKIAATFRNWLGQPRYVVEHRIEGGRGCFYHIYSNKELESPVDVDDPEQP